MAWVGITRQLNKIAEPAGMQLRSEKLHASLFS